jgi:hypothetical protein
MSLIVAQLGDQTFVDQLTANILNGKNQLHLFSNDHTPVATDTLANYTEATFDGYSSAQMTGWSGSSIVSSHAVSTASAVTFTQTGTKVTNNIYGIYVTSADGKTLLYAERDPAAPVAMNANGATYTYTPKFSCISEF